MEKVEIFFGKKSKEFNKKELEDLFIHCGYNVDNFDKILSKSHKILLAYHNNELIGFLTTISNGTNFVFFDKFGVKKTYRNKGIEKKLFGFMLRYYNKIPLQTIIVPKEKVNFYKNYGFQVVGNEILNNKNSFYTMFKINYLKN